jgi:glycolate oxidase iron-sulfur subunit
MKTNLVEPIRSTPEGKEANDILRACVHCGFCTATCPTYQLLGDELDGPRGRIYLIKEMLEGNRVSETTQLHLDRCLTCRACETTCPSGVRYGRLVDIGRNIVEKHVKRSFADSAKRSTLNAILPNQALFKPLLRIGQSVRPLLPQSLRRKVPAPADRDTTWPDSNHPRKMLVLDGCVQPVLAPEINAATARVLDRIGISLIKAPAAGCCGAVTFHLNKQHEALDYMRRNIDSWWGLIGQGAEAIVMTASGCATMVRDYAHLLADDPRYAQKAERVTAMTRDLSEIICAESEALLKQLGAAPIREGGDKPRVAFHSPCTLQHGQQIRGKVEEMLGACGYDLTHVPDSHLCCGSAGTYSILQEKLSQQLLKNKVSALESGQPVAIATANIGCLTHIRSGTDLPVRHWIELLDNRLID